MNNQQFTEHLRERLEAAQKAYKEERTEAAERQVKMLDSALKIMTHGTGPARRRFRRDYERRLARQGIFVTTEG